MPDEIERKGLSDVGILLSDIVRYREIGAQPRAVAEAIVSILIYANIPIFRSVCNMHGA